MKSSLVVASAVFTLFVSFAGFAQENGKSVQKVTDLIGQEVRLRGDEKFGRVDGVTLDLENGRVALVIVAAEQACANGEQLLALPPCLLKPNADGTGFELKSDREKVDSLPRFSADKVKECCLTNETAEIYRHLGEEPYFAPKFETNEVTTTITNNVPKVGVHNLQQQKIGDTEQIAVAFVYYVSEKQAVTNYETRIIPDTALQVREIAPASKILGMVVRNDKAEQIGYVDNIMVDVSSGRLVAMVVSSGEYLSNANLMSAVPSRAFRTSSEEGVIELPVAKETLLRAPSFDANQWPDFSQPAFIESIYTAYGLEPSVSMKRFKSKALTGK